MLVMYLKTIAMLGIICLMVTIMELDFFTALPKFGAEHFGAPDDIKEMTKKMPDRPRYVVVIGIIVLVLAFLGVLGSLVWAVIDTYINYPGWLHVFFRFLIIGWGYKLFDIVVFDWLFLTKIRLPEKLAPETKGAKGYDSFGFNAKSQIIKIVIFLVVAILAALIYWLICK